MDKQINKQILEFIKYFSSIKNNTNKSITNAEIKTIIFNPQFYKAFIKKQYISKNDTQFKGYPFKIDNSKYADYWGMMLSPIEEED